MKTNTIKQFALKACALFMTLFLSLAITTTVSAQQPSGSYISNYNFAQGAGAFFEQNGVVAPFKTTLANGTGVFTSTSNAFLLTAGFTYTINGTTYQNTGAVAGNAFLINSNGWISFNNNGTANSTTGLGATTTPLTSTTVLPTTSGAAGTATSQGNGVVFSAMGRALVANAAGANGIANGSECYVVSYGDGVIVVEWRNMKPGSAVTGRLVYEFIIYPDNHASNPGGKAYVQFVYGPSAAYTGTASTSQVGARGWQGAADGQMRISTTSWSSTTLGSGDATNAPAVTSVAISATILPASGFVYQYQACTLTPTFAALPV